ncbi:MAG: hypothetical protein EPO10_07720 [Reyranella sp.]|uniref:hypothetical protein n=1 Tax=Reyranella sp. TaxID=1929291 RepID=UPI00121EFAD7|nr:hypothetical protein [Reyranella sp.]TAJ87916.1 MAG: hypothetical protein EPO41_22645 [Reyranella sp.]TBR29475.1 MAG: hypothetical protein EPO10_07720 [Reyranella sp.]
MSGQDRRPTDLHTPVVPHATASGRSGLPWIVAGLLLVVLAAGYFALGIPILKAPDEARAPELRIDGAIQPPAAVAPAERRP